MSEIFIEIEEMYNLYYEPSTISKLTGIPLNVVLAVIDNIDPGFQQQEEEQRQQQYESNY